MSQTGKVLGVSSRLTDFAATLAQNAALSLSLPLPEAIAAGRQCECLIRGITVVSYDALAWEFQFFQNNRFAQPGNVFGGVPAGVGGDGFLGYWAFGAGDGVRIGGAGLYYYYIDGLGIYYNDDDQLGNLNVLLVNRSAGGKTANALATPFRATFNLEPTAVGM